MTRFPYVKFLYINVYEVDRCYGGPEEGGWYYDSGRLETSIPIEVPQDGYNESVCWADRMKAPEDREFFVSGLIGDLVNVLSKHFPCTGKSSSVTYRGGDYRVLVEDKPGADYPAERPYYS